MSYKVLRDGNGSGFIRVIGLGDYMPLKDHQAMVTECEEKSKAIFDIMAERDALAAQVGLIRETWDKAKLSEMCNDITSIRKAINATPVQCLAEIRAEAGRAGFVAGINYLDKVWCKDAASDVVVAADEYAAKVRQGGE